MSSSKEFTDFVCEQLRGVGLLRSRKMFGEYCIYVDDKPLILVCDDTVFIRQHPSLADLLADAERGCPYEGAKEHYILDIDQAELSREAVRLLAPHVPLPKKKRKIEREEI